MGAYSTRASRRRVARLGARGRLVLPADVRDRLQVAPGDEVIIILEADGGVRLTSRADVARRGMGMLEAPPGRDLVAELLAERRAEASGDA